METNYYTGLTIPLCKTCNIELVSPKIFKKFRRSTTKNGIGDNASLKGIRLNGKVYFRRICEDCYFKKRNKKLPKCNLLSYEYEHIFDISKEEIVYCISKYKKVTLENMIERYGEELGNFRWQVYLEKQKHTKSKEYHMEKFGRTEEEWNEFNKKRFVTLENMKERYGEEEGQKRWESYLEKQKYSESVEYSIEKYGEEEGRRKFIEKSKKKAVTYKNTIEKYGEEEGRKRWEEIIKNQKSGSSKMAQNFFIELNTKIIKDFPEINQDKIYFNPKGLEFASYDKDLNVRYYYDFVITSNINLCIEFNGDVFHANPNIYKEDSKPIPFFFPDLTAKDIWEKDERKFTHIKKQGFAFACVWESQLKIENFLDLFYKNVKEYISNKLGVNSVKRS